MTAAKFCQCCCAAMLILTASGRERACAAQGTLTPRADSLLRRVQRLSLAGSGSEARALVDSVLSSSLEGSADYIEALFRRATIAESADQARRDYLRIALEYPLSPRAEDSLLRLAQLALARGDRVGAKKLLERLALEHATGVSRAPAAYWMGRVLFDDGAIAAGCASLAEARLAVSPSDVELSNQIAYYAQQCAGVQRVAEVARADSVARAAVHRDSTLRADSAALRDTLLKSAARGKLPITKPAVPNGPAWSVQVAAFPDKPSAVQLAKRLTARGYAVRVTQEKPFRVRVGRFGTRGEASALVAKLRAAKMEAIVVAAEKP
jgi:hypothetical protein